MVAFHALSSLLCTLQLPVTTALHLPPESELPPLRQLRHSLSLSSSPAPPMMLPPPARDPAAALAYRHHDAPLTQQVMGIRAAAPSPLTPRSASLAAARSTTSYHALRRRHASPLGADDLLPPDDPALWGDAQSQIGQGSLPPAREAAARGFRDGMLGGGYLRSGQRDGYFAAYEDGVRKRPRSVNASRRLSFRDADRRDRFRPGVVAAALRRAVKRGFLDGVASALWLEQAAPDDTEARRRLADLLDLGRLNGMKWRKSGGKALPTQQQLDDWAAVCIQSEKARAVAEHAAKGQAANHEAAANEQDQPRDEGRFESSQQLLPRRQALSGTGSIGLVSGGLRIVRPSTPTLLGGGGGRSQRQTSPNTAVSVGAAQQRLTASGFVHAAEQQLRQWTRDALMWSNGGGGSRRRGGFPGLVAGARALPFSRPHR